MLRAFEHTCRVYNAGRALCCTDLRTTVNIDQQVVAAAMRLPSWQMFASCGVAAAVLSAVLCFFSNFGGPGTVVIMTLHIFGKLCKSTYNVQLLNLYNTLYTQCTHCTPATV
jgi:hypothetical protein